MPGGLQGALLDRDGTINVKAPEGEYVTRPEDVELLPGAGDAIRLLNEAGVPVVVVTNQRGIALGRMDEGDLDLVHQRLQSLLSEHRASIGAFFHCPHDKGVCACRKPEILLLRRAQEHLGLATLQHSIMIGDSPSDVQAGRRAGARTMLLALADPSPHSSDRAPSLLAAVRRLL